jgi:hypothetical protein
MIPEGEQLCVSPECRQRSAVFRRDEKPKQPDNKIYRRNRAWAHKRRYLRLDETEIDEMTDDMETLAQLEARNRKRLIKENWTDETLARLGPLTRRWLLRG